MGVSGPRKGLVSTNDFISMNYYLVLDACSGYIPDQLLECLLDVVSGFGGGFHEGNPQVLSRLLSLLHRHLSLTLQIYFISHQNLK